MAIATTMIMMTTAMTIATMTKAATTITKRRTWSTAERYMKRLPADFIFTNSQAYKNWAKDAKYNLFTILPQIFGRHSNLWEFYQ